MSPVRSSARRVSEHQRHRSPPSGRRGVWTPTRRQERHASSVWVWAASVASASRHVLVGVRHLLSAQVADAAVPAEDAGDGVFSPSSSGAFRHGGVSAGWETGPEVAQLDPQVIGVCIAVVYSAMVARFEHAQVVGSNASRVFATMVDVLARLEHGAVHLLEDVAVSGDVFAVDLDLAVLVEFAVDDPAVADDLHSLAEPRDR